MPLFFFHSQTDTRTTDVEGTEFPDHLAARQEVIKLCGELLRDAPAPFWGSRPWSLSVTDARGLILYEINVDGFGSAAVS